MSQTTRIRRSRRVGRLGRDVFGLTTSLRELTAMLESLTGLESLARRLQRHLIGLTAMSATLMPGNRETSGTTEVMVVTEAVIEARSSGPVQELPSAVLNSLRLAVALDTGGSESGCRIVGLASAGCGSSEPTGRPTAEVLRLQRCRRAVRRRELALALARAWERLALAMNELARPAGSDSRNVLPVRPRRTGGRTALDTSAWAASTRSKESWRRSASTVTALPLTVTASATATPALVAA